MCSPEIASRCARLEARSVLERPASRPERSPVRIAAAKPPFSPGIAARMIATCAAAAEDRMPPAAAPAASASHHGVRYSRRRRALVEPGMALEVEAAGLHGPEGGERWRGLVMTRAPGAGGQSARFVERDADPRPACARFEPVDHHLVERQPRPRRRHPLRALADRLPAYRRRAHGAVQLALYARHAAGSSCCGSRTPTARAPPRGDRGDPRRAALARARLGRRGGQPVHARSERHAEVAHEMLARGTAYRCYATPGGDRGVPRAGPGRGPAAALPLALARRDPASAPDAPFVIRLKAPRDGETVIEDRVQGTVTSRTTSSTTWCCCARTARRPTCWRWWSTITTWA
jgi:hypothetical protein